jgi:hypothetical protein
MPMPAAQSKLAHLMFARAHKNVWRDIPRLGAPTMAPAAGDLPARAALGACE